MPPQSDIELLPEAALQIGAHGQIVAANELARRLVGISGLDHHDFSLALLASDDLRSWHDSGSTDRFRGFIRLERRQAIPLLLQARASKIDDGAGSILCLLCSVDAQSVFETWQHIESSFDDTFIGVAQFDLKGRFLRANSTIARMLDRSEERILGCTEQELSHPDDPPTIPTGFPSHEHQTVRKEKRFVRPDGSVVWVVANLTSLHDEKGDAVAWVGQYIDITAHRSTLQLLETRTRQLEEAQQVAMIGSWEWDVATNEVHLSDEMYRQLGLSRNEGSLDFHQALGLIPPEERALVTKVLEETLESGAPIKHEYRLTGPDGQEHTMMGRGRVIRGNDGRIERVSGTSQDITEQVAANSALAASEKYNRQIVEHAPDPFVAANEEGRIIDWNPAAERTFGWALQEAIGSRLVDTIIPPVHREAHLKGMDRLRRLGKGSILGRRLEMVARHKDGHLVPVEFTVSAVGARGERRYNAFVRDVSPQAEARAAIAKARDAALEASQQKSDFLANMSHEIRTPMNAILGMSRMLLDSGIAGDQHKYASTVHQAGESLLQIIDDILDFSKIEAGKLTLKPQDFNLPSLIREVQHMLAPDAYAKGLELTCTLDKRCPKAVHADAGRIRQILINLISNAIKFTEQGQISIRVGTRGHPTTQHMVRFEIADTGIGIPDSHRGHLFKPFHQVDSSLTRSHGGTGLGLVICRQLVELMGGTIGVRSVFGKGSEFWFRLPLTPVSAGSNFRDSSASPPTGTRTTLTADLSSIPLSNVEPGDRGRLLLAEDNPVNQQVAVLMVGRLGYSVETVANGEELLHALSQSDYAAVLMDCQMPVMDGFEATRTLRRSNERKRHIPVIAMTASAMKGDRERCLAAGMDDYISKPVQVEELAEVLQRWVPNEQSPSTDPAAKGRAQ